MWIFSEKAFGDEEMDTVSTSAHRGFESYLVSNVPPGEI